MQTTQQAYSFLINAHFLNHSIKTLDVLRNFVITFDSDFNFRKYTSLPRRPCLCDIRDLRFIRRYICL